MLEFLKIFSNLWWYYSESSDKIQFGVIFFRTAEEKKWFSGKITEIVLGVVFKGIS